MELGSPTLEGRGAEEDDKDLMEAAGKTPSPWRSGPKGAEVTMGENAEENPLEAEVSMGSAALSFPFTFLSPLLSSSPLLPPPLSSFLLKQTQKP